MSIDVLTDELIPISRLGKLLPQPVSYSTAIRWCLRGVRKKSLDSVILGGKRYTTQAAPQEFFSASSIANVSRATDSRAKEMERAERELRAT